MIQGGDPTKTGKGGDSIWGKPFKDEYHPLHKFDERGMIAMANNGPDTNKSQFFIVSITKNTTTFTTTTTATTTTATTTTTTTTIATTTIATTTTTTNTITFVGGSLLLD